MVCQLWWVTTVPNDVAWVCGLPYAPNGLCAARLVAANWLQAVACGLPLRGSALACLCGL